MFSAKAMSEAIRMKRKKLKDDGVENMVDTSPAPQMNAQDVHNLKMQSQIEQTIDVPEKSEAPSDPADSRIDDTQKMETLKKRMARVARILGSLSVG